MSSKRAKRRKMCDGKVRHLDAKEAKKHIHYLHLRKGYQGRLDAYKCPFCNGYHVGHTKGAQHS